MTTCTRKLTHTRIRIDQLLTEGWSIVGRDPVLLQRCCQKLEVRSNGIIITG